MKSFLTLILYSIIFFCANSQTNNIFDFPINKNNQNFLSGTMGELRGDHFHMGLDIKTGGKIGIPVYASKNGYIERIRISIGGYGKAIYMKHSDGKKTVYAHLSKFNNTIEDYIVKEQYKKKSFEITKYPEKDKFYYKKGELIGYSGNSGSSSGPHLHFEIRDFEDNVLDPLSFLFEEIEDTIKPTFEKIVFKTLDINSRINGAFGFFEYNLIRKKNMYYLDGIVSLKGNIGIAIYGYDRLNMMPNKNGIKKIEMYLDGEKIINNNIDQLSFFETEKVVRYIDYNLYNLKKRQYIKLYQDDGNNMRIHRNNNHNGVINIKDNVPNSITINIYDSYDNKSVLNIKTSLNENKIDESKKIKFGKEKLTIIDNVLELKVSLEDKNYIDIVYNGGQIENKKATYTTDKNKVFLISLKQKLPKKIITQENQINSNFISTIFPDLESITFYKDFEITSKKNIFFDTLYLRFEKKIDSLNNNEIFSFINKNDISNKSFSLKIKPIKKYNKEKSHVYSINNNDYSFVGGIWENNIIEFKTKILTDYTILTDTISPEIKAIKVSKNHLSFKINDNLSGIKEYSGKINEEWILFNYDYKRDLLFSQKINKEKAFIGNFELKVIDNAGNIKTFKYKL